MYPGPQYYPNQVPLQSPYPPNQPYPSQFNPNVSQNANFGYNPPVNNAGYKQFQPNNSAYPQ